MCIKLSRRLNPMAEEWRPIPHQRLPPLPHQLYQPVSQPLVLQPPLPQPAVFAAPPSEKLLSLPEQPFYYPYRPQAYYCYGVRTYSVYSDGHPFYYVATPADVYAGATAEAAKAYTSGGEVPFLAAETSLPTAEENVGGYEEKMVEKLKSRPSSPSVRFFRKGLARAFPPRLLKAQRRLTSENTPPAPVSPPRPPRTLEWRPRRAPRPDQKVSGDRRRASQTPPAELHLPPRPPSPEDVSNSSKTTVMIKNIPNQLRRDFMLKFLDDYCKQHALEYDFFYLPMDFGRRDNLGYAFVNFTSNIAAMEMKKVLQGFKWGGVKTESGSVTSKKICDITWARIQGKEALIRRFEKSSFSCDRWDFLPVILDPARNGSDLNPPPPVVLGSLNNPEQTQ